MQSSATLTDLFSNAEPSHAAVILPEREGATTYAALSGQVETLASRLRLSGICPGDPVAIILPNGLEFLVVFLSVTRARLVAAPLNPAYKSEELKFYMEDAGVRAVIGPAEAHPAKAVARDLGLPTWTASLDGRGKVQVSGEGLPEGAAGESDLPRADDVALFLHTSGTTSRPKGVPLTHANLMASISNIAAHYRLTADDTGLVVMPLFHVHGLIGATLSTFRAGGTVVVPPRFSTSAFWPTARQHCVTWYSAVPTIHQCLLNRADADGAPQQSGFRFIRSCSSALAPATLAQLESCFDAPVIEAYAMTEASHQMTANPLPPEVHKPGSVGRGANVDVAIMDESGKLIPVGSAGEVVVRGPNVTRGYHNNPEANAAAFTNGWFRTGDRGLLDSDNYLTLIGRIKELINRGGEKISPLEVDGVLLSHPAVAEAATFGAPDPKYGEEVHAAVVLKSDATVAGLQAHCRARLADFKVPKVVHLVKELPKGPTGKLQRRHIASAFHQGNLQS
jgi:acyl-CoA synthetase (AMP-forming)/AMP-acid ligase II